MAIPKTLQEAILHYSDYENCRQAMMKYRWPDGKIACPHCGSEKVTYLANARIWKCYGKHDKPRFSLKTGTIFEDSPIGLEKWLPVMWMLVNSKNGISSWEIHRAMGVTQKTAWFMLQRARLAMQDDLTGGMLKGEVEIDESFIGGKARFMHKSRKRRMQASGNRADGKTIVMGMVERKGKVRATVIPDRTKATMQPIVLGNVQRGSEVFTDEWAAGWKMDADYVHKVVNHLETYVQGNVHTNTLENFWSCLKRGIGGTYISVEPFHLFRYIDEQAFRYNYRKDMNDADRFDVAMRQAIGKRLTYAELTGKVSEEEQPIN